MSKPKFFPKTTEIFSDLFDVANPGVTIRATAGYDHDVISLFENGRQLKIIVVDQEGNADEIYPESEFFSAEKPRKSEIFCQQMSERYERLLDLAGGDPRVVSGEQALRDIERRGGWFPDIESRDARRIGPER